MAGGPDGSDGESPSRSRRNFLQGAGETLLLGALAATAADEARAAPDSKPAARSFEGRTAIITGAARGQGRSHAVRLAAEGANLVLCDILAPIQSIDYPLASQADMDETVRIVEKAGAHCLAIKADVRDPKAAENVVTQAAKTFGAVDFLLANAGVFGMTPVGEITDQGFDDVIKTNLYGPFNFIRAVSPGMAQRGFGRIIVTSSQTGRMGLANGAHYSASKWAVIGLVKSVALELARHGVTVNAVCPTTVNTPLVNNAGAWRRALPNDPAPTREKFEALMREHPYVPQGIPWVEPGDVSDAILFLLTDGAKHITGSVIDVQAGVEAGNSA